MGLYDAIHESGGHVPSDTAFLENSLLFKSVILNNHLLPEIDVSRDAGNFLSYSKNRNRGYWGIMIRG
jgi:hypothetical protein